MKKIFIFIILTTITYINMNAQPVNKFASKEARELLKLIKSLKNNVLSGQHNYPCTISEFTDSVKEMTGKTPAIWGQDFGFTKDDKDGIVCRPKIIEEAIKQHRQGSIITLMWHSVRPFDDEPNGWKESVQNEVDDEQWDSLITPNTKIYDQWAEKVDTIASYLKILQENNIPVLWRPYHEMNGGWFWWGKKEGEKGYIALWKNLYDRLVNYHKLNNLVWVWNANAVKFGVDDYADYYPGHDYVDVLATDIYGNYYDEDDYLELLKVANGKPIAIGECGELPTPEVLKKFTKYSWFMCWTDFVYNNNSVEEVSKLYHQNFVLSQNEFKNP